jgi:citrate lyase beta subunit
VTDAAPRLGDDDLAELDRRLGDVDARLLRAYPGDPGGRQPVHTVYVPADLVVATGAGLVADWSDRASRLLRTHLPGPAALSGVLGCSVQLASQVHPRVVDKLAREPVEDLRVDFEDGYGARPDDEEDAAAVAAGATLAQAVRQGVAPPFCGLRCKGLEPASRRRGLRTLDLFLGALLEGADLPAGFVVTLPKVTAVEQVEAFVDLCARLEQAYSLPSGRLRFEVQVETPQAVLGADGTAPVARMVHASAGRCAGLHFGTYDYSAALGVPAEQQSLEHPVADHAKAVMQLAAAGTGVRLSDGSTNVVPAGSPQAALDALRLHARLVRRSLERAYYQGWDLHPGQLPTRFAANYAFYRQAMPAAADRLRAYVARTERGVLDEPATAQALAGVLVRGLHCGALDAAEVRERTGLERAVLDRLHRRRVG